MLVAPPQLIKRRECKQRKNAIISGLLNNHEKETQIGDNVTFNDCVQAPTKFKIHGKEIKQETREGYNLVDENQLSAYQNIDTIKDGVITSLPLTKEGIINFSVNINEIDMLEGDYYISCDIRLKSGTCKTINSIQALRKLDIAEVDYAGNIQPFNVPVTNSFQRYVRKYTFSNINDDKFNRFLVQAIDCENAIFEIKNIQISREDKEYEKFGASPSIEYPSPIEYVEGNQDVEHFNKNIFNESDFIDKLSKCCKVETEFVDDIECYKISRITEYRIDYPINFNKITTMQVIAKAEGNVELFIRDINEKKRSFPLNKTLSKKNLTIEGIKSIGVGLYEFNAYIYIAKNSIQLEEGTEETDYVSHQSEIYQLSNLPPMYSPENKIVYLKDGAEGEGWYVYNKFNKVYFKDLDLNIISLDNDTIWGASLTNKKLTNIKINTINSKYNISNFYSNIGNSNIQNELHSILSGMAFSEWNTNKFIYFSRNYGETAVEVKSNINQDDNYIIYELEEPTYTKITDEILIDQLNKLRRMLTYEGRNHFIVTAENGQACNLEVTVYKNSIKIMQKEIDNLKELVLNNVANS